MAGFSRGLKNILLFVLVLAISTTVVVAQDLESQSDSYPLRPADTSSPRATIQSFIENVDKAYLRTFGFLKSYAASDRLFLNASERGMQLENIQNLSKAIQCLDLSEISPVLRNSLSGERVLQLKEVLDRIEVPSYEDIPDREQMLQTSSKRWRFPDTEIDIVLIEEGPRAGEYLVSANTVNRLPDFYKRVRRLPYKPGLAKQLNDAYRGLSSGRTNTLYEAYLSSPLRLARVIPTRWMLSWPDWATNRLASVTVWQWLGFSLGLLTSVLFVVLVGRVGRRLAGRKHDKPGLGWHHLMIPLAVILVVGFLMPSVTSFLNIGGSPLIVITFVLTITLFLGSAWVSVVGGSILGETVVKSQQLRRRSMDSQLIRLGMRFIGVVVAIGILFEGASHLGIPAYSVLAGLGVGGLAVALAARDSLANLLGSIVIMFEKPFRVGHWIKVGEAEGTVEDVGFRSTRIRTFYNSLISIPNNEVVNAVVDNLGRRTMRRQMFFLQVTYDTSREKIEEFVGAIEQHIREHPRTDKENLHIRFNGFGESGLDILLYFFLRVPDYVTELKEREQILLWIMDLAKEIGVGFAFPTRTLHLESTPETAGNLSNEESPGSDKLAI